MALPTPTFLGQVYTDTTSGRSWVCVSLTPPVWAVNKNVLLSIQGGLSVSGGASITGGLKIAGGLTVTGGATITGGVALYGTVTVNGSPISLSGAVGGSGIANVPLASASVTGVASFGNQFVVSNAGAVGLTSNYVISVNGMTGAVTLTLASSAPLASSSATGVASFGNEFVVSNLGAVGFTSNYVKSVNGSTGAVLSIATTGSNTFTGLQTLNAGLTTNYLYVSNGATFANGLNLLGVGGGYQTLSSDASNNLIVNSWNYQSYKVGGTEKLYIGAAGISATGLYVSSGATFAGTVSAVSISAALNGNASTATTLATARKINETPFNGGSDILINQVYREDNRIISPSAGSTGYSRFVFTAWNNNGNNAPYADGIHFRTYVDSSGGNDNLLMLRKDAIGMRLWQQTYGSTTPYSVYKDVAFIQDVVTSFNGLTGAVSGVTTSAANTFTALNTFNAGLTTTHLHVTNGATFAGTVSATLNTAAQPNITSVGTLTSLSSSGLVTASGGITSNHLYVTNGVTFAGTNGIFLAMNASNPLGTTGSRLVSDSNASGALKITTPSGYVNIGPQNTGFSHFVTDIGKFYFNRPIQVNQASGQSTIGAYASDLPFTIGTPDNSNGTLITRIAVLTGPDSSMGGYVGIGTTTPQAKLEVVGNTIIRGSLSVTGGTASFNTMSVGTLTGSFFAAQQGFVAGLIYVPNSAFKMPHAHLLQNGMVFRDNLDPNINERTMHRWGNGNLLSIDYGYGFASSFQPNMLAGIIPPPVALNRPKKIIDVIFYPSSYGHFCLLEDKSLTGWGAIKGMRDFPPIGNFLIDVASGLSANGRPTTTSSNQELAGWWLGLMENGRLTGSAWTANSRDLRYFNTYGVPTHPTQAPEVPDYSNPVIARMPASLRWDATSGITAKAILGSDDAYCYALLSDGSLTAWGATCFSHGGGSGGVETWTTGGTGGYLSNFPPPGMTFTKFASTRATKTIGFAIKPDGNLLCFGYTGGSPAVAIGPNATGNVAGVVDYRHVFCTNRTGDNQIVKVDIFGENHANLNAINAGVHDGRPRAYFISEQFVTNFFNSCAFVGLTKGGSLTAGILSANMAGLALPQQTIFQDTVITFNKFKDSGVTFSDIATGLALLVTKRSDGGLNAFGPTSGIASSPFFNNQQTIVPSVFAQGLQTTVRFGGPVNISKVPLGVDSDPYTQTPILDVRGGIVAGQFSVASDSSTKSSIAMEQTNDGVVSFWKKDLLENLAPQEFNYLGDTSPTTIGYFAENAETANPNYVTRINPININANGPPNSTNEITTPYSAINLNTLLVGTIESLRELNTEMPRIWTMEAAPYPSKVKNGDLWYYSSENRLYIRKNETWIQIN